MKKIKQISLLIALGFITTAAMAQNGNNEPVKTKTTIMKTYVIEREIPAAGSMNAEQLKSVSQKSCSVLTEMGPGIQWIHSYVTGNKLYCIYKAENEELIREHAKKGGFPCNKVSEVANIISPETAK